MLYFYQLLLILKKVMIFFPHPGYLYPLKLLPCFSPPYIDYANIVYLIEIFVNRKH